VIFIVDFIFCLPCSGLAFAPFLGAFEGGDLKALEKAAFAFIDFSLPVVIVSVSTRVGCMCSSDPSDIILAAKQSRNDFQWSKMLLVGVCKKHIKSPFLALT